MQIVEIVRSDVADAVVPDALVSAIQARLADGRISQSQFRGPARVSFTDDTTPDDARQRVLNALTSARPGWEADYNVRSVA
jgi:hypothetical protein